MVAGKVTQCVNYHMYLFASLKKVKEEYGEIGGG